MKLKLITSLLACLASQLCIAAPSFSVSQTTALPGEQAIITLIFNGDGVAATAAEMLLSFDNSDLTPDLSGCGVTDGSALFACVAVGSDIQIFGFDQLSQPISDTEIGFIEFQVSPAAMPGTVYDLTISDELYFDVNALPIASSGSTPGSITIISVPTPAYSSTPDPGSSIAFVAREIGQVPAVTTVEIQNTGTSTSVLNGSCVLSGSDASRFNIQSVELFSLIGAESSMLIVECNNTVSGMFIADLNCSHDGGLGGEDETGLASYPLSCQVIEDNSNALFDSSPNPGGEISFTPVPVLSNTSLPDQLLTLSNTALTGANDLEIACTLTGDSPISAAPDLTSPINITPGNQTDITFSCDTSLPSNTPYTARYDCQIGIDGDGMLNDGSITYPVSCDVTDALFDDGFEV